MRPGQQCPVGSTPNGSATNRYCMSRVNIYEGGMRNGPYELVPAPAEYPGKKYRGRYCYEHILVWWQATGQLPQRGEVLHHKDGNKRNNTRENLELLTAHQHRVLHGSEKLVSYVRLRCPSCGALFSRERRLTHLGKKQGRYTACSRRCAGALSGRCRPIAQEDLRVSLNVVSEFRSTRADSVHHSP